MQFPNLPTPAPRQLILVTGPARSGKSEWAETLAFDSGKQVIYVATAQVDSTDPEWQFRIEQHRERRPRHWKTVEVPVHLAEMVRSAREENCLLIDSLGTWVANILEEDDRMWEETLQNLVASLKETDGSVILVAEETGWGVVPAYPAGRLFRDRLGVVVREVGAIANPVYLVTGGYALNLSALGSPLVARTHQPPDTGSTLDVL